MRNTSDTKNNSEENNSLSDEVIVHSGTLDNQDVMEKSHSASDTQQSVGENKKLVDILDKYGKPLYNQDVMENDKYVNGMFTLLTDLKQYRAAYSDLYAVYGENWKDYLNHYLTYGFYEKRNSFGYFDARAYAHRHPEAEKAAPGGVYRHCRRGGYRAAVLTAFIYILGLLFCRVLLYNIDSDPAIRKGV